MPIALHIALLLLAFVAIGVGAWSMMAALVAAIAPAVSRPGFPAMPPFPPLLLAAILTLGLMVFLAGANGLARLALLP